MRRVDVKAILRDPVLRRRLLVEAGLFLQHMEGIDTTREQMEEAYDKIQEELRKKREVPHGMD